MRRLARGVAWLLIAFTATGTWPAARSIAELSASTDRRGAINACLAMSPATPEIAARRNDDRVGARHDRAPYSCHGLIVDDARADARSARNVLRDFDVVTSTSDSPDASRGRAPPLL